MRQLVAVMVLAAGLALAQGLPHTYSPLLAQASGLVQLPCTDGFPEGTACFQSRYDEEGTRSHLDLVFLGSAAEWRTPWTRENGVTMRAFAWLDTWHVVAVGPAGSAIGVVIQPTPIE